MRTPWLKVVEKHLRLNTGDVFSMAGLITRIATLAAILSLTLGVLMNARVRLTRRFGRRTPMNALS